MVELEDRASSVIESNIELSSIGNNNEEILDLVVVGAGPHSLSLMNLLYEPEPDKYQEHPDNKFLFYKPKEFQKQRIPFKNSSFSEDLITAQQHRSIEFPPLKVLAKRDPRFLRPTKQNWDKLNAILNKRKEHGDSNIDCDVEIEKDQSPKVMLPSQKETPSSQMGHDTAAKGSFLNQHPKFNLMNYRVVVFDKLAREQKVHNDGEPADTSRKCAKHERKRLPNTTKIQRKACQSNWLKAWDNLFSTFQIGHLRSPFSHHPYAGDPMTFWYYAKFNHRMDEFTSLEIKEEDLLDQDPLEHGNGRLFKGPFLLPGSRIFRDFVQEVVIDRAKLEHFVQKASVKMIVPKRFGGDHTNRQEAGNKNCSEDWKRIDACYTKHSKSNNHSPFDYYEVVLEDGQIFKSKNVVIAKGTSGAIRNYPDWCLNLYERQKDSLCQEARSRIKKDSLRDKELYPSCSLVHCFDIGLNAKDYFDQVHSLFIPESDISSKSFRPLCNLKVTIVGGGLTSLNLAKLAVNYGCEDVEILSRQGMRIQPFDITHKWIGPDRNRHLANFWSTSHAERRLGTFQAAKFPKKENLSSNKSAASVTREGLMMLNREIVEGKVKIREFCEITNAFWDSGDKKWTMRLNNNQIDSTHLIWLATGVKYDIEEDPMFSNLMQSCSINTINGYPVLRSDLSWSKNCPGLYVMGQYGALILGPGAGNLAGGRAGAVRITKTLKRRMMN